MEVIHFQELIWEQKKFNISDMFWLQIGGLISAPLIPAGIRSFRQNPVE